MATFQPARLSDRALLRLDSGSRSLLTKYEEQSTKNLKPADAAAQEYEQRHRHNAWLCSNYYTLRAIIVLMAGPLADTPRYVAYFENIESEYTVWQALMSRTIELFVEVNIFATEARK